MEGSTLLPEKDKNNSGCSSIDWLTQSFETFVMILLSKCFHGNTQVTSKLISSIIQKKCLRNILFQHNDLEMGVLCTVISIIKVLKKY